MKLLPLTLAAVLMAVIPAALAADGDDPKRQARWNDLKEDLFQNRPIEPGDKLISIEAPTRAADATLVPITLRVARKDSVKAIHLVIDENPAPYAAKVEFGPAGDSRKIELRVRVNDYTNVHAVAEAADGKLYQTAAFVKAAGGCSAPAGGNDAEMLKAAGQMRMKFSGSAEAPEATLMVRHPNFTGMQMDQVTRLYTAARYVKQIRVTQGGRLVFDLTGDISLSADPVITFAYANPRGGDFEVQALDSSGGRWAQTFSTPAGAP